MSAEPTRTPAEQGNPLLAASLMSAAAIIILALILPLPGIVQAAVYLLVLPVVPGGALLVIVNRTSSNWLVALIGAVVVSIAIVMTTSIVMAYLGLWAPTVVVAGIALLCAVAGAIEFNRFTR